MKGKERDKDIKQLSFDADMEQLQSENKLPLIRVNVEE